MLKGFYETTVSLVNKSEVFTQTDVQNYDKTPEKQWFTSKKPV
jgi:hypothetical protein